MAESSNCCLYLTETRQPYHSTRTPWGAEHRVGRGESGRQLGIDQRRPNDGVIHVLRGVFERRGDVVVLQIWKIGEDIRSARTAREQIENILHA